MKLTSDIQMRLDALKDKFILFISGENWLDRKIELGFICGWEIEEVPEKKGLFGHPACTKLTEIHVIHARHVGTTFMAVYNPDSAFFDEISRFEEGRKLFVKLKDDINKFGFDVTKREGHTV